MNQPVERQEEIKIAYKDIYEQFQRKTSELFSMYSNKISGLEERVRNPEYGINGNDADEYLYDFPSFYQIEGVQFLLDQKRILIADEMGVGKTAQAVAGKIALENELGKKVKTLIVCPNQKVKSMWEERLKEYITKERYSQIKVQNISAEDYKTAEIDGADVVLIDYNALSFSKVSENNINRKELKKKLMNAGFEYVILDEVHNAKNFKSASRFEHVNDLASRAEYLCLLSGTPIPTNLQDTYALIALLKPEQIDENGNKTGYKDAAAVAAAHRTTPSVIGAVLRASRLERMLESVANLPEKKENYVHIKMNSEQTEVYDSVYEDDTLMGLQKIQKLLQVLLNPAIIDESFSDTPRAKFEKLDEILNDKVSKGEKVVVYSPNFKIGVIELLKERYAHLGAVFMDGDNESFHEDIVREFQGDSDKKVLIMNNVGGEGISLTGANNLVFLEEPFSPGKKRQVIGREWRPGQTKPVDITTLNVDGTIDDGLREYLEKKRIAIDYVEKGIALTEEQEALVSGNNNNALQEWLKINRTYLYTPSQKTGIIIGGLKEKPEDWVRKKLEGKKGEMLAQSLNESWENSVLENCASVCSSIVRAVEKREGGLEKIIDIASGFGSLSHSMQRKGIYNVDADKHHFNSSNASSENINLVGKMTSLPIKEDGTFDFALCSMALDILPNTESETARPKAIAEANRVLKDGGHYVITLPAPLMPDDGSAFRNGLEELGFEVVPELSGFVKSKDKKINTHLYVITARKYADVVSEKVDFKSLVPHFKLNNTKEERKGRGATQRRKGKAEEFEFVRADGTSEDLNDNLESFARKEAS